MASLPGETLIMLDSRGEQARKSAFVMVGALVLSGLMFLGDGSCDGSRTTSRWR